MLLERLLDLTPLTMGSVAYNQTSFAIAAQEVAVGQPQMVTFSASGQPGSLRVGFDLTDNADATITIPSSVFNGLNSTAPARITHALFANDKLFISSLPGQELGGLILATSVAERHTLRDLTEPVRIMFRKNMVGVIQF